MKLGYCYKSTSEPNTYHITCDSSVIEKLLNMAKKELQIAVDHIPDEIYEAFYAYQKLSELLKKEEEE